MSPRSRKQERTKNLKSIAFTVYHYLRKFEYASYSDLSAELYSDKTHLDDKEESKNIRRRLYDAVNVMISSNVLVKNKNTIEFNHENKVRTIEDAREEEKILSQQVKEKEKDIDWKKKYLKHLKAVEMILEEFYERNQEINDIFSDDKKVSLPIVAANLDSIDFQCLEEDYIEMINKGEQLQTETEMQLLARLFPSS